MPSMSLENRELALLTPTALRKITAAIKSGVLAIVAKVHARPTNFLCVFPCFSYLIQQKAHKRTRETVQTTNSSVVVDRLCSFLLTVQLLQHVRGRHINEVKRLVQELGG